MSIKLINVAMTLGRAWDIAPPASIELCIRTFEASISAGTFEETSIPGNGYIESNLLGYKVGQAYYEAIIDTHCPSQLQLSSLTGKRYAVDADSRWLQYNLTFNPTIVSNSTFPSSMLESGCLYALDGFLDQSLFLQYYQYFFNGTITGVLDENDRIDRINRIDGPQNLQTIYNYDAVTFDRIDSIFHNISDAVTTYIRQAGNSNNSSPAIGVTSHNQTCLQVRWGWLSLPAILVLATNFFFVAIILQTRPKGDRAQIWKSSPLAYIFHGLDQPDRFHGRRALEGISDMEETARRIKVKLVTTEKGARLVPVNVANPNQTSRLPY